MWYGFGIGLLAINISYIKLITTTDWDLIIFKIQDNIEKQVNEYEMQKSRDTPSTGSALVDEENGPDDYLSLIHI